MVSLDDFAVRAGLIFLIACCSLGLIGCGGVADAIATHELNLRVSQHGKAVSGRTISVAMRPYENVPFTKPEQSTTDVNGHAHAQFKTMWGAAFFIIPPIGAVPSRPPKPVYSIRVAGREVAVSPSTGGSTYQWKDGSWHTDAVIDLP